MDTDSIAWAAGLFEGEGCITISTGKQHNGKIYSAARLKLNSTDEDVVRRFHSIVGCGNFREERSTLKRGWKMQWEWYASSKKDVATVLELLGPWLGQRRSERADEIKKFLKDKS